MRVVPTPLDGLVAIEPERHLDGRGFFAETYRLQWHERAGIPPAPSFVQDNHSRSTRGVVAHGFCVLSEVADVREVAGELPFSWHP